MKGEMQRKQVLIVRNWDEYGGNDHAKRQPAG